MNVRRSAFVVVFLVVASMVLAPTAISAELWDGKWRTKNPFGNPKLDLTQTKDYVEGTYADDNGANKGKIWGDLSERKTVWSGRYKDNDGSDKGKFRVELQSDQVSFVGWFKSCESWYKPCSDKYSWTGEHN